MKKRKIAHNRKEMMGLKFGRLTVIEQFPTTESGSIYYRCLCDCGVESTVRGQQLRRGATVSCGCFRNEKIAAINRTHGKSKTPFYNVWVAMNRRCYNKNDAAYGNYGGRGIKVCDRWRNSFEAFAEDMGIPEKGLELDRKNNLGNYEPTNCRWVTPKEQSLNRRSNKWLTFRGETLSHSQWEERLGYKRGYIYARLKMGWSVVKILTHKIRKSIGLGDSDGW